MNVGTKIRNLRIQNKWSQEELAFKLNVAQTSVSNFEANKTIPDFLVMQKVCAVFAVDFEHFREDNELTTTVKKVENSNTGYHYGIVNKLPDDILKSILERLELLETIIKKV